MRPDRDRARGITGGERGRIDRIGDLAAGGRGKCQQARDQY
jgi:hypothetical protein